MLGAIIGDLAGSIYEYGQLKNVSPIEVNNLIEENSFISDDTILTMAILDSIINHIDYDTNLRKYGREYMDKIPQGIPYFKKMFSPGFEKWTNGLDQGSSIGNGAIMRISPIGYLFDSEEEIRREVIKATSPSHNSSEAIDCATTVALIIYYARNNYTKEDIISKLGIDLEYKPFEKFNGTCNDTIGNCLYALFTSNSFEESIRKVISYGGDTDTNGAITGSMAEALYNIPSDYITKAKAKLPEEFLKLLDTAYTRIKNREDLSM